MKILFHSEDEQGPPAGLRPAVEAMNAAIEVMEADQIELAALYVEVATSICRDWRTLLVPRTGSNEDGNR